MQMLTKMQEVFKKHHILSSYQWLEATLTSLILTYFNQFRTTRNKLIKTGCTKRVHLKRITYQYYVRGS